MTCPYTDPEWDPASGGLPERRAWPSPTAGTVTPSTIDPPTAEPLSPYTRAELERIATDVEAALAQLRAFLRRP